MPKTGESRAEMLWKHPGNTDGDGAGLSGVREGDMGGGEERINRNEECVKIYTQKFII